jgi:hypothetical protein
MDGCFCWSPPEGNKALVCRCKRHALPLRHTPILLFAQLKPNFTSPRRAVYRALDLCAAPNQCRTKTCIAVLRRIGSRVGRDGGGHPAHSGERLRLVIRQSLWQDESASM